MPNNGFVQVFTDQTGKKVDTEAVDTGGGNFVHRQRTRIGGELFTDLATVTNNRLDVNTYSPGTEADAGSNNTGDGLVALTGALDIILAISVTSGSYLVKGWSWAADRQCSFRLEVADAGSTIKILRVILNSSGTPSDSMNFTQPIQVVGAAGRQVRVLAQNVNGTDGHAAAGINGATL